MLRNGVLRSVPFSTTRMIPPCWTMKTRVAGGEGEVGGLERPGRRAGLERRLGAGGLALSARPTAARPARREGRSMGGVWEDGEGGRPMQLLERDLWGPQAPLKDRGLP